MNENRSDEPARQLECVVTRDGARLTVKRRPGAGTPVIFLHGLAVNGDLWDLPTTTGPGCDYRSLATVLLEGGFDIWLLNFRGHGAPNMLSAPPPNQTDWSVDHFILFDLPAVVEHVLAATGRKPFIIGGSMGAMTLGGYAQGATLVDNGGAGRVFADPELAAARATQVAGAVFVEFPAALRWPNSAYHPDGRLNLKAIFREFPRTDADANYPFEMLARWGWLEAMITAAGQVPLGWMRRDAREPWWSRLPRKLAERITRVERAVVQGMLRVAGTFTGAINYRAEVLLHGRQYIMDQMKAGVLAQMAKSVRQGAFVSTLGSPDHVYSEHYANVRVPTLVVAGGRDRIANAGVTREVFFERIQSRDKTFRLFPEIAHGEFEAAPIATALVYPEIKSWLGARDRRTNIA